eukprot:TRINITY_DN18324_c0_g1_i2.p1 TRINITY_DN18324_c0_g1~~TRINITY_DN18324_c0_g1_i2.p1  ORF type:complete len:719 (-),score=195.05 TRINITY_DN18324_c0_g1_i2:422-2578(-)
MEENPKSSVFNDFPPFDFEGRNDWDPSELISFLRSAFRREDFAKAEEMLRLKEEKQKACERRLEELEKELEGFRIWHAEMEEKNKKAEVGFRGLIVEIERKEREGRERIASLETKLGAMDFRKFAVDQELETQKRLCGKLEKQVARLEEDHRLVCEREQRAREKIARLEVEVEQEAQEKFVELKVENRRAENEIADYKKRCGELEVRILQLEEDNSNLRSRERGLLEKIRMEPKELLGNSCYGEKTKRESLGMVGHQNELVHAFADVGSSSHSPLRETAPPQTRVTPLVIGVPSESFGIADYEGPIITGKDHLRQVRQKLLFNEEQSSYKKETPVRANCAKSREDVVVVSDDEMDIVAPPLSSNVGNSRFEETYRNMKGPALQKSLRGIHSDLQAAAEENASSSEENITLSFTPKRKHASKVIASDNEGEDDDDKVPLSRLKMKKLAEVTDRCFNPSLSPVQRSGKSPTISSDNDSVEITPSRRRIIPLRECGETKHRAKKSYPSHSIGENLSSKTDNVPFATSEASFQTPQETTPESHPEADEVEHVESDSEGESLGGFIVQESDGSESKGSFADSSGDEAENGKELKQLLEGIRRKKDTSKWEYEADLLSSFSQDPVLCMKAVCALYRQQTSDEKSMKGSLYANNRGFSKFDALKGSLLADFLTDGDPHGPLKKSVEELEKHDPKALEYCSRLASHYSKQLFEIYKNKEDPYFLPC